MVQQLREAIVTAQETLAKELGGSQEPPGTAGGSKPEEDATATAAKRARTAEVQQADEKEDTAMLDALATDIGSEALEKIREKLSGRLAGYRTQERSRSRGRL